MPQKKYKVTLTKEEGDILQGIINRGKHGPESGDSSRVLLFANEGRTDGRIAERTGTRHRAIESLRQRFVEDGFEVTLGGKANASGAGAGPAHSLARTRRVLWPRSAGRRRTAAPGGR